MPLFRKFERLLHAYPEAEPAVLPKGFVAFIWACSRGARGYILTLALLAAAISAFEALMFAMLGRIVDWLGKAEPARLWIDHGATLTVLAWIVLGSVVVVAL